MLMDPDSETLEERAWLHEALVWGQVNVNEQDPATFDTAWWADYWASCRLDGVTLNIGGPVAYYPTRVPLHPRASALGDRDLLADMVEAAKGLGLRVLGRLDPTFTTAEVREAHPDWCMTGPDGEPYSWDTLVAAHLGRKVHPVVAGERSGFLACNYSPHFDEVVLAISTEVLREYDLDGIWTNGWPFGFGLPRTMCHCPHCLQAWERAYPGRPRPERAHPAEPAWRDYVAFASARLQELQRRFRSHVHQVRPGSVFVSSCFTRPETTWRWGEMVPQLDALGIDAQGRTDLAQDPARRPMLWSVGLQSELTRAVAAGKPILRFLATYQAEGKVIRHGARPAPETGLQMAQALAHGERPKWHSLGGTSYDRRWMPTVREFDAWMATHRRRLLDRTAVSDVGVVWSPQSVLLSSWRTGPGPSHAEALVGWYLALMEARIPFEYVHEDHLEKLDHLQALVLPSGLCLPDAAVEALEAFAARGGAVIACCGALRFDEWDEARAPDAVRRLLGVEYAGDLIGPSRHSCIAVDTEVGLLAGLGDTDIVGGPRWIAPVTPSDGADRTFAAAWIPDYPTSPTQDVVLPSPRADVSLLVSGVGAGGAAAVYVAADLDAAYARDENPDHGVILTNAVRHCLTSRSVEVRGEGLVDVRPWRQAAGPSVFLVNVDNPRTHGGMVRALRPIGPLEVVIRLEPDEIATRVRLLRHDAECAWQQTGSEVVVQVPVVEDFELVAVDVG
jgi:hypothetical protein